MTVDDTCVVQVSGWLEDLGHMRGDRGREDRRTQEWILAEGQNTGTSETALEWVVYASSSTARLELTKALDAGKN